MYHLKISKTNAKFIEDNSVSFDSCLSDHKAESMINYIPISSSEVVDPVSKSPYL